MKVHPKPSMDADNMVEFFLGRSYLGVPIPGKGTPVQTVTINGHDFEVEFGKRNRVPREVYQVFVDAQSRSVVPDMEKAERAPRANPNGRGGSGYVKYDTLPNYELDLIKEGK
jgi:hypothetical protein